MTKEKVTKILKRLEKLKESCLLVHNDSITYQVCELLQEIIVDIAEENNLKV